MNSTQLVGPEVLISELASVAAEEVPEFVAYIPEIAQNFLGYTLGSALLTIELGPLTGELAADSREMAIRRAVNDETIALSGIELSSAYHFGDVLAEVTQQFIEKNPPVWQLSEEE